MPTYTYRCTSCEKERDVFHGISAKPRIKCEACGGRCKRMIGSGAGIIFKGSGFYETDYKTKSGKPDTSGESTKKESSSTTSEKKTDTKEKSTKSSPAT